ncbi:MAG: GNAT family N-acetyltransferase [Stellaceae bacterium]
MSVAIDLVDKETAELRELVVELDAVLGANYQPHQRHGLSLAQLFEPHVRFFIVRLDGTAMGCGGVALFDDHAEVKRMYTRPAARGRGLAKALLQRIEDEARVAGKSVLRLETGPYQHEAIGLYRRMGFTACDAFGAYTAMAPHEVEMSVFFEKTLD